MGSVLCEQPDGPGTHLPGFGATWPRWSRHSAYPDAGVPNAEYGRVCFAHRNHPKRDDGTARSVTAMCRTLVFPQVSCGRTRALSDADSVFPAFTGPAISLADVTCVGHEGSDPNSRSLSGTG